jgi:hypothetical protein
MRTDRLRLRSVSNESNRAAIPANFVKPRCPDYQIDLHWAATVSAIAAGRFCALARISIMVEVWPGKSTRLTRRRRLNAAKHPGRPKNNYRGYFAGAGIWESSLEDSSLNAGLEY